MPRTISDAGEHLFGSTAGQDVPRVPEVHRLYSLFDSESDREIFARGKGGELAPFGRPRRVLGSPVLAGPRIARQLRPYSPPASQIRRINDSWREFGRLRIAAPSRVRFCVQRLQRKQVLFARGIAGRRGSAPGPYRRTENSNWRC